MAIVTYNIKATSIGTGYLPGTTFLFYTSIEDCGVGTPVDVSTDQTIPASVNEPVTIAEFIDGLRFDLDEAFETLYVYPLLPNPLQSNDCRLGCENPSHALTLSGFIPAPTPSVTPTLTPTITPTVTPTPTITPTPTTSPPSAPLPDYWRTFGTWTISKFSNSQLRFTNTGYNRISEAQSLANFLAADGYISSGQTETIITGVRIHTSDQSTLDAPNPAYQYINLDTYRQAGSGLTWFESSGTAYVDLTNLLTIPADFVNRTDVFLFYNINDV